MLLMQELTSWPMELNRGSEMATMSATERRFVVFSSQIPWLISVICGIFKSNTTVDHTYMELWCMRKAAMWDIEEGVITFLKIFIVIQLQLYAFSPHPSTPPLLNPPPSPTSTLPLDFVHVSFIVVPLLCGYNKI